MQMMTMQADARHQGPEHNRPVWREIEEEAAAAAGQMRYKTMIKLVPVLAAAVYR